MPFGVAAQCNRHVTTNLFIVGMDPSSERNEIIHWLIWVHLTMSIVVSIPETIIACQICNWITTSPKVATPNTRCSKYSWDYHVNRIVDYCLESLSQKIAVFRWSVALPWTTGSSIRFNFNPDGVIEKGRYSINDLIHLSCSIHSTTNFHITFNCITPNSIYIM